MKKKVFYCPVNGWDCPYWEKGGTCLMVNDGDDPTMECDDAYSFWEDEAGDGSYFVEIEVGQ